MMPIRAGIHRRILGGDHRRRRHHIVDFRTAVVDRVVKRLAVADAAAIFRRDDDVAARGGFANVWNVVLVQMTADVLVHPHERRMLTGAAQPKRLKDERGDVEIAFRTAIADLLDLHEAVARRTPGAIGLGLLPEHPGEVGPACHRSVLPAL